MNLRRIRGSVRDVFRTSLHPAEHEQEVTYKEETMKHLLTLLLAGTLALAGCGEGSGDSPASGKDTAAQASSGSVPDSGTAVPAAEEQVIRIAYLPITHSLAGLEAARAAGENRDGIRIEMIRFGSWTELIDALNTGRVDAAFALVELVMKAREQGMDVYLSSLAHRDGNVIVVADGIRTAADLRGKTFAIPHRQSSHYILLNEALARENVDISEVKIVELPPPEMPSALASGQVAGYCVAEPFGAKAVSMKLGHVLYNSADLWPDSICCGFALSGKFLKEHPDLAALVTARIREAGMRLEGDHRHEAELATASFKVTRDALDLSLKWISFDDLTILREHYEALREKVVRYGLSEAPVAFEDIVRDVR